MPDGGPITRGDEVRAFILANVDGHPSDIAGFTATHFSISRQAVHIHLRALETEGALVGEGKTRARIYRRPERVVVLPVKGLSEDAVYSAHILPLLTGLPENVRAICGYGVTEMVNNVIDHSDSPDLKVSTKRTPREVQIQVIDRGIGIFRKIQEACHLEDIRHAVFELTKGKLTTDPARHTGEGIFFTSRIFDVFSILSQELFLQHRRDGNDWLLEDRAQPVSGTIVTLTIATDSSHTTSEVFQKYATEQDDYAFNRTHVLVELSKQGEEQYVSRSQAKRIVSRLDKFKEVVLDFSNVREIGPAFADQIFRVFAMEHPDTHLLPINMSEEVTKMVRRAQTHDAKTT
jgi:anti-sigma regulatory factor (Ser/Thr protein kinase)